MTKQDQRIALAKCDGWKTINGWFIRPDQVNDFHAGRAIAHMPNYPNDLNAVHELEKKLDPNYFHEYIFQLGKLTGSENRFQVANQFALCHATAPQRCEALLRTLGLWKETLTQAPDNNVNKAKE